MNTADADPGGRREGENPEEPPPEADIPLQPPAAGRERGPWAPRGPGTPRVHPVVKRRRSDKVTPLSFPPTPGLCSLGFTGQFKVSPQNQGESGIRKEGGKNWLATSFRYWFSTPFRPGPLPSS